MDVTVTLPDDIATRFAAGGTKLARRTLEVLAAEEYRAGRPTKPNHQSPRLRHPRTPSIIPNIVPRRIPQGPFQCSNKPSAP